MIIAVDGPTASGKGTIAKALAERIEDPALRALAERRHGRIGNTGHWIDSVDAIYGK